MNPANLTIPCTFSRDDGPNLIVRELPAGTTVEVVARATADLVIAVWRAPVHGREYHGVIAASAVAS